MNDQNLILVLISIYLDIEEVNGLSIDWVSKHVYWTDAQSRTIEVSDYNGGNRRLLITSNLDQPRGIYADPING